MFPIGLQSYRIVSVGHGVGASHTFTSGGTTGDWRVVGLGSYFFRVSWTSTPGADLLFRSKGSESTARPPSFRPSALHEGCLGATRARHAVPRVREACFEALKVRLKRRIRTGAGHGSLGSSRSKFGRETAEGRRNYDYDP